MEGVFNNAFIGWDGDGVTYRVVLVPGLVLPAPESAAHIKKRRQSELSHRRDESQPDRSPSRPNVEIVLQDRQDPTECGVSSERRRGATRKKRPLISPTRLDSTRTSETEVGDSLSMLEPPDIGRDNLVLGPQQVRSQSAEDSLL